jgi:hypothetical protein
MCLLPREDVIFIPAPDAFGAAWTAPSVDASQLTADLAVVGLAEQ